MTDENTWIDLLVQEATRDLMFLWHIMGGHFGGPKHNQEDSASVLSRVANGLLACGCKVGFGDPDGPSWRVPPELAGPSAEKGEIIAQLWQSDPAGYEFLAFAHRSEELALPGARDPK